MQEKTPEPARGRIIPCPLGFEKRIFRLQHAFLKVVKGLKKETFFGKL
jgi:hypothetical protein